MRFPQVLNLKLTQEHFRPSVLPTSCSQRPNDFMKYSVCVCVRAFSVRLPRLNESSVALPGGIAPVDIPCPFRTIIVFGLRPRGRTRYAQPKRTKLSRNLSPADWPDKGTTPRHCWCAPAQECLIIVIRARDEEVPPERVPCFSVCCHIRVTNNCFLFKRRSLEL